MISGYLTILRARLIVRYFWLPLSGRDSDAQDPQATEAQVLLQFSYLAKNVPAPADVLALRGVHDGRTVERAADDRAAVGNPDAPTRSPPPRPPRTSESYGNFDVIV